jgi:tetratricopeptide (TPR) repeat protein
MHADAVTPDESYVLGQDLANSGKYSAAIVAYTSALNGKPDHVKARIGRGMALQRLGEHAKAIADFDEVISRYFDWPGASIVYYSRAASRHALGQTVGVIEDCDQAIRRSPNLIDALYLRGSARNALGDFEAAMRDMDAVLNADPTYYEAYRVRGTLHCVAHRWQPAIDAFTLAIRYCSYPEGMHECTYLRGIANQELGDHPAAVADFARVIELAANHAGAYIRRSRSYRELGEFESAERDLQVGTSFMNSQ